MTRLLATVHEWEEKLAIRRSTVLFTTLWMTWRSFTWATAYVSSVNLADNNAALAAATMIAAVTAPIAALQGYVFKAYIDAKGPT